MVPVTADDLERMAFERPGTTIEMRRGRAYVYLDGITYGAVIAPPPPGTNVGGRQAAVNGAKRRAENDAPCTNEFCEHDHAASPDKAALLAAIRNAATTALNSVYGTDDRHEYMALRIADSAVNGTPLPWRLTPPAVTYLGGTP